MSHITVRLVRLVKGRGYFVFAEKIHGRSRYTRER